MVKGNNFTTDKTKKVDLLKKLIISFTFLMTSLTQYYFQLSFLKFFPKRPRGKTDNHSGFSFPFSSANELSDT